MPTEGTLNFPHLSSKQAKILKTYLAAIDQSVEYTRPYFEKFIRFYRLFAGELPPELDGTFSKVMLNIAYQMVETELPHSSRAFLTAEDWVDMVAREPELEIFADIAKKWLVYQMEDVQNVPVSFVAPVQSTHIFGTGYRVYGHKFIDKVQTRRVEDQIEMGIPISYKDQVERTTRSVISGQYASVFSMFPSPVGGMVNAMDDGQEGAVRWLIWVHYKGEKELKKLAELPGWNKEQIGKMLERRHGSGATHPAEEYEQQIAQTKGLWKQFATPDWIRNSRSGDYKTERQFMCSWFWQRDRWTCIGENYWVLYDGPPIVDCFPVAKFTAGFDLDNWFGRGLIELSEDLILSIILNLNHRLDYLAGTMHPPTWVPETVVDYLGGDLSKMDPEPYQTIPYPDRIENIQNAVWHDRFPEISNQAFLEDEGLQRMLQKIAGQPDVYNAMGGGGRIGDIGATGVVSMIDQSVARSIMRAINVENTGVRESAWLTLKYGAKYKNTDEKIRVKGANGWPWENIPHEAITDGYGISITGTRSLNLAEETFKKMMMAAQIVIGNPAAPGQAEVLRQLLPKAGYDNIDAITGGSENQGPPLMLEGAQLPDTQGAQMPGGEGLDNRIRSTQNRQTVEPNSGAPVAAGNILV